MSRTGPHSPTSSKDAGLSDDAETVSTDDPSGSHETVLALYVTGPNGGARHVLPSGLVTLGRSAEATIVVSDPRVSRSHAALHVGKEIMLSDLGSANGTFLGRERLASGEARALADGQSFSIGDSVLVVRPCALLRAGAKRLSGIQEILPRLQRTTELEEASTLVAIRVRAVRRTQQRVLELVLGEVLAHSHDFMLWLDDERLVLGVTAPADQTVRLERDVIRRLGSFSVTANVSARVLSFEQLESAGDGLFALLSGEASVALVRGRVVFEDPAMKAVEQTVLRVAKTPVSVLVLGETGAGKDVIAAMLHELSPRADGPFLAINCASLPEALLESELFGHERGAFTGAIAAKPGLLEASDGGTVFLDEVGDLPLALQAKLLRVFESREVTRLGALKPRKVDVRFVAATNRDLVRDVSTGRFRQDLYYRLNAVAITVPPLRERRADIVPLAELFLESARFRFETADARFSSAALSAMNAYTWPGNVRELKSAVERAAILTQADLIEPNDLGLPTSDSGPAAAPPVRPSITQIPTELDTTPDLERERVVRALDECGGNQSRAAKMLGISRRTLVRKIAELGLPRPREKG